MPKSTRVPAGYALLVVAQVILLATSLVGTGSILVVAATDAVPEGVLWSFFHYPGSPGNAVVTADAQSQPINPRQPFKFGRGKLKRLGSSNLSETMSFVPRNIFP